MDEEKPVVRINVTAYFTEQTIASLAESLLCGDPPKESYVISLQRERVDKRLRMAAAIVAIAQHLHEQNDLDREHLFDEAFHLAKAYSRFIQNPPKPPKPVTPKKTPQQEARTVLLIFAAVLLTILLLGLFS